MYLTNSPVVVSYSEKIKMKKSCEFESRSWRSALDTTMSDKVCQWLETGRLFSPGTLLSSTTMTARKLFETYTQGQGPYKAGQVQFWALISLCRLSSYAP